MLVTERVKVLRLTLAIYALFSLPITPSSATNVLINIDFTTASNGISEGVISPYYLASGSAMAGSKKSVY